MTGYLHPLYAESLAEFGQPLHLPGCGGWVLERPVPGSDRRDATGCYPLFCCRNWSKLKDDLKSISGNLVSVALALDPFSPLNPETLSGSFDIVRPFKEHFVVDLAMPSDQHVDRHHRYYARKSLEKVAVQLVDNPADHLEEWVPLYQTLIERHRLRGIKAFSRACFQKQFKIPGLIMFRASCGDQVVGAQLWYIQDNVAYSHLTAVSDIGYSTRITYGIYWTALEIFKRHFSHKVQYLDLGAGAGLASDGKDGLAQFKRGWSTGTRMKYFVGKIFDHEAYAAFSRDNLTDNPYFPAYRKGEF